MLVEDIISKCNLSTEESIIFKDYLQNKFSRENINTKLDESFIKTWENIYTFSLENGVESALNTYVTPHHPIHVEDSSKIRIELYRSFVGRIPIIYIEDVKLFEEFIINTLYKGVKPTTLSEMGAAFCFGKTTRFIVLSNKPYSNIPASDLGLADDDWLNKSMIIRREHECTHYFTKTVFGISRNHLHDELLADFFGLYEAFGYYKAEYFQRFLGILGDKEGRLKFYTKQYSKNIFNAISLAAKLCSEYLEVFYKKNSFSSLSREEKIKTICLISLEDMINKSEFIK